MLLNTLPGAVLSNQQVIWYLIKKMYIPMLNLSLLLHKKNFFCLSTTKYLWPTYCTTNIYTICCHLPNKQSGVPWEVCLKICLGTWSMGSKWFSWTWLLSLHCSFQVWSGADTHSPTSERDRVRHSCASMSYTQLARVKKEFCTLLEDTDAMSEPAQARRMHRLEHGQHYDSTGICWRHQIISGVLAISIFLLHHVSTHRLELAGRVMVLLNVLGNEWVMAAFWLV